jgi:hypothetical protein
MKKNAIVDKRQHSSTVPCPDGVSFCIGETAELNGRNWHDHRSAEYSLAGSYLPADRDGVVGFCLEQLDEGPLYLAFSADGQWIDLNLPQVDELLRDFTVHVVRLRTLRDQFAEATDKIPQPRLRSVRDQQIGTQDAAV